MTTPASPSAPLSRVAFLASWLGLGAVSGGLAALLYTLGLPAASLFAGLIVGIGFALVSNVVLRFPRWMDSASQAVIGVVLGALVQLSTLQAMGHDWFPITLVTVATLAISVVAGLALSRFTYVDPVTGSFSLIAGGAVGIAAMSRELGADERLVAVVQYLRLVLVFALTPVLTAVVFRPESTGALLRPDVDTSWPVGLAFTVGCCVAGAGAARLVRMPAGTLLGPLILASVLTVTGVAEDIRVPSAIEHTAYVVCGLGIGVGFTRATVRLLPKILPAALALIIGMGLACAALGMLLVVVADVTPLTGYLATTPGGMFMVLATAADSGADTTFTLAVQVLRMMVMLLIAPVFAVFLPRWVRRAPTG